MKFSLLALLTLFSAVSQSQDAGQPRPALRFGAAIIPSGSSLELGLGRHNYHYRDSGYYSKCYYSSIEWWSRNKAEEKRYFVYSIKAGYERTLRPLALGIEAKYQTDFDNGDFLITPKVGIRLSMMTCIFYGYGISTTGYQFPDMGYHQFSVVVNMRIPPKKKKSQ